MSIFNKTINIEVDGVPVPVDKKDYEKDPEAVIALVRKNRSVYSEFLENIELPPDFDTLMLEYTANEESHEVE